MGLIERLEEMRSGVAGCMLVSFGDLSSGLVLRTSAARALKQDYLDHMLQQAAVRFDASDAVVPAGEVDMGQDEVLIATPEEVRVFIRSPDSKSDVVICVCQTAEALGAIRGFAEGIFHEMSEAA